MKLVYALALSLLSIPAWTAEAVIPGSAVLTGSPGQTLPLRFSATNIYPFPVTLSAEITPGGVMGEAPLPAGTWITPGFAQPMTLAPEETRELAFSAQFPPISSAASGAITLVVVKADDPMGVPLIRKSLPIRFRPGVPMAEPALQISHPTAVFVGAGLQGERVLEVSVVVHNTGNVHSQPRGTVDISSSGRVQETVSLTGPGALAPGVQAPAQGRTLGARWPDGDYEARINFYYGGGHGKPRTLSQTYRFRVSQGMLSFTPGSVTPPTVTP